jgi:hypothetical protein
MEPTNHATLQETRLKSDRINYLIQTDLHVVENIKLADQKATVFVTIQTALLAALLGAKLLFISAKPWWLMTLSITTFVLLVGSLILAGLVIWPRGEDMSRKAVGGNLAFPTKIAMRYETEEEFQCAIAGATEDDLVNSLGSLVYIRAKINDWKYWYLKGSIATALLGAIAAMALYLVSPHQ